MVVPLSIMVNPCVSTIQMFDMRVAKTEPAIYANRKSKCRCALSYIWLSKLSGSSFNSSSSPVRFVFVQNASKDVKDNILSDRSAINVGTIGRKSIPVLKSLRNLPNS